MTDVRTLVTVIRIKLEQDKGDPIELILSREQASYLCSCLLFADNVSKMHDCNDCKDADCPYKPRWGENVRFNCPLWKGEGANGT